MTANVGGGSGKTTETDEVSAEQAYWAQKAVAFKRVLDVEDAHLKKRRAIAALAGAPSEAHIYDGDGAAGVAISGGGIRSATFGLGILQFLAGRDLLRQVDYLSTVSGGGYVGSSLTWFLHGKHELTVGGNNKFPGLGPADFPYGTASADRRVAPPDPENEHLRYLRRRGRYLTPGKGITILSGIGVALRGVALNILVWGPLATLAFLVLFSYDQLRFHHISLQAIAAFVASIGDDLFSVPWFNRTGWGETVKRFGLLLNLLCANWGRFTFDRAEYAFYTLLGAFMAGSIFYSVMTFGGIERPGAEPGRYVARRLFEKAVRWIIGIGASLLVLLSLPYAAWHFGAAVSGGIFASGILGGGLTFLHTLLNGGAKSKIGRYAPIVAALFLYGAGLVTFICAVIIHDGNPHLRQVFTQLVVAAVLTGALVNINYISLHRFYRDRLMEAFLPDARKACFGMSFAADIGNLHEMVDEQVPRGPYHLINTHMITTNVDELREPIQNRLKLRGGDNFVLAPLHCGSTATEWVDTASYCPKLSLATAMAISGAAANPNAGVGGMGVTRSTSVALVMALLNVRLGYWLKSPVPPTRYAPKPRYCNHFSPGLTAAFAEYLWKPDTKRRWIQLSDGGHFDNTGMYELFRRRVGLIIFCDGSADPEYRFEDLHNALERAHKDFGVVVTFDANANLNFLMPREHKGELYPREMLCAERPFALARIEYPAMQGRPAGVGTLIVMSTVVTRHASLALLAHKDVHRDFPDESTMDQFFEEGQFEAYRELGWNNAWITMTMLRVSTTEKGLRIPTYDSAEAIDALRQKASAKNFA